METKIPTPKVLKEKTVAIARDVAVLRQHVVDHLHARGHSALHSIDVSQFSEEAVTVVANECQVEGWFVRRDDDNNLILKPE
jgi:hypothetical protein